MLVVAVETFDVKQKALSDEKDVAFAVLFLADGCNGLNLCQIFTNKINYFGRMVRVAVENRVECRHKT